MVFRIQRTITKYGIFLHCDCISYFKNTIQIRFFGYPTLLAGFVVPVFWGFPSVFKRLVGAGFVLRSSTPPLGCLLLRPLWVWREDFLSPPGGGGTYPPPPQGRLKPQVELSFQMWYFLHPIKFASPRRSRCAARSVGIWSRRWRHWHRMKVCAMPRPERRDTLQYCTNRPSSIFDENFIGVSRGFCKSNCLCFSTSRPKDEVASKQIIGVKNDQSALIIALWNGMCICTFVLGLFWECYPRILCPIFLVCLS